MQTKTKNKALELIRDYLMIVVGSILYVISVKCFAAPMQIPSGGVSGIALLTNYLWNAPIGVVTMALNVPLLLAGFKGLGRDFFCKTMFMIIFSSVLTDMAGFLPAFEGDILLAAIFGGILKGIGYGMIIRTGGTSGGVDVIGKFMYKQIGPVERRTVIGTLTSHDDQYFVEVNGKEYKIVVDSIAVEEQSQNNIYEVTIKYKYSMPTSF